MVQSVQKPFFRRSQVLCLTTRAAADIYAAYLKAFVKQIINSLRISTLRGYLSKVSRVVVMILKNSLQVYYLPSFMSRTCPISISLIDKSEEYNIMVSRRDPCKARLGVLEVLRSILCSQTNIIMKPVGCIIVICNFLMILAADVGLAALGAWIINLGINGIR